MNEKVHIILAELRRRFERLYGERLVRLVLYGSQARGDAEPGSDIDVLVVLRDMATAGEEIDRTLDDVSELSLAYNAIVACIFVSEERYRRERSPLLLNVHREGVPM